MEKSIITTPCPLCGRDASRLIVFNGTESIDEIMCANPQCRTMLVRKVVVKVVVELIVKTMLVILVVVGIWKGVVYAKKLKNNCASFQSREQAQQMFNSNPKKYKALDRDRNGKVCEIYPY